MDVTQFWDYWLGFIRKKPREREKKQKKKWDDKLKASVSSKPLALSPTLSNDAATIFAGWDTGVQEEGRLKNRNFKNRKRAKKRRVHFALLHMLIDVCQSFSQPSPRLATDHYLHTYQIVSEAQTGR